MRPEAAGRAWLAWRAFLAVGLTVLFYAFALGLAAGLFAIAWASLKGRNPSGQVIAFCTIAGIAILWGILPRWERFEAPGPRLREGDQPRLFRELRAIAKATDQAMPEEVYLVRDVNAGVLERGGVLGFGGRRVMVLGLPLMAALRVPEFRGVLAHEFGHYHGGETRLGPWIHRTHGAIGRTIRTLGQANSVVRFLFVWYGKAFLRVTKAVSRRQELAADELAARVAGAPAMADGLRASCGAGQAFDAYFRQEVGPVLSAGFRPPLSEGFHRFLGAKGVATTVGDIVERTIRSEQQDPYDSHPPLRVRLGALGNPDPVSPSGDDPKAAALLDGLDRLERDLLDGVFGPGKTPPPLPWGETGAKVFLPLWRKGVREDRALLEGLTPAGLPAAVSRPPGDPRWKRKAAPAGSAGPPRVAAVAGAALVLHLVEAGWTLDCAPGQEIALRRGDETLQPFREIGDLATGATPAAAWAERCRLLGIGDLRLDAAPTGPGPEARP